MNWISFNDETPPDNTRILVCDWISGFISFAKYFHEIDRFELMNIEHIEYDSDLTHWMPLPALPEEEI